MSKPREFWLNLEEPTKPYDVTKYQEHALEYQRDYGGIIIHVREVREIDWLKIWNEVKKHTELLMANECGESLDLQSLIQQLVEAQLNGED